MDVKVITLRYSPERGIIDDGPLLALGRDHQILGLREHFFVVHDIPHLLCVVSCQRRSCAPNVAVTPRTSPGVTAPAPAPSISEPDTNTRPTSDSPAPRPSSAPELTAEQQRLYDAIRRWRATQAERDGVPRYVVLTNRNVDALVRTRPDTITALRRIPGIGKTKADRYGEILLQLLHPDRPIPAPRAEREAPSAEIASEEGGSEGRASPLGSRAEAPAPAEAPDLPRTHECPKDPAPPGPEAGAEP